MCGIAGYLQDEPVGDRAILERMTERIRARGPDGSGQWFSDGSPGVALGHRRLAIIDIGGGAQPMPSADGRSWIVYNGEITNFRELREDLARLGYAFRTRSDTEVVLAQYLVHGAAGLSELRGMFAFAVWDGAREELFLARDRYGIKPMYYCAPERGRGADGRSLRIAFASELSALAEHPGVSRAVSAKALQAYFFLDYVPAPLSIYESVRKLEPGAYVKWTGKGIRHGRFAPTLGRDRRAGARPGDAVAEFDERVGVSVERQMVSDVPVGVLLSGGLDSATVAYFACQAQRRSGGGRLMSFSLGFEDPQYDERGAARLTAEALGTEHHERLLGVSEAEELIPEAIGLLDEPMGDPSIVPTCALARFAREKVKVTLSGDGGDEVFGGYPTYLAHRLAAPYSLLPAACRSLIAGAVSRMPVVRGYQSLEWKLKRFTGRWDDAAEIRHLRWMSAADAPEIGGAPPFRVEEWVPELVSSGPLERMMELDLKTYLPGSVLTKVDRMSMAVGLEVRPPLLDPEVVDWGGELAPRLKLRGSTSKWIMRRAMAGRLPEAIVRGKKRGFGMPVGAWLAGVLRPRLEAVFADSPLWETHAAEMPVSRAVFRSWFDEHVNGTKDRAKPLWNLLVLDSWMRGGGRS